MWPTLIQNISGACRGMATVRSKPPVPPHTSLLFGHNATALLPHRASIRRNIRLRIGQRAYSDRLLESLNLFFISIGLNRRSLSIKVGARFRRGHNVSLITLRLCAIPLRAVQRINP